MPGHQPIAGDGFQAVGGPKPARRRAIGVIGAIERRRKDALGNANRIAGLLLQGGEHLAAHPFDLGRRIIRALHDICKQRERCAEVGLQRIEGNPRAVHARRGADAGAQPLAQFGNISAAAAGRAFIHQVQRHRLDAERPALIRCPAAFHAEQHAHQRHRGTARQFHFQAIGKGETLDRRPLQQWRLAHGGFSDARRALRGRGAGRHLGRRRHVFSGRPFAGQNGLHIGACGQPRTRGSLHIGGRGIGIPGELRAILFRIAGINRAFGQRDRLAAKAAHGLQPADGAGDIAGGHAAHFVRRRPLGGEVRQRLLHRGFHGLRLHARRQRHLDFGHAHLFKGLHAATHRHGEFLRAHQFVVQPR